MFVAGFSCCFVVSCGDFLCLFVLGLVSCCGRFNSVGYL